MVLPQSGGPSRKSRRGGESTATISLRLPEGMLEELRVLANQREAPYQSLLKIFLAERLAAERDRKRRAG